MMSSHITRCATRSPRPPWFAPVTKILEPLDREIFLSVEYGKIDEAERSLAFPQKELAPWLA